MPPTELGAHSARLAQVSVPWPVTPPLQALLVWNGGLKPALQLQKHFVFLVGLIKYENIGMVLICGEITKMSNVSYKCHGPVQAFIRLLILIVTI